MKITVKVSDDFYLDAGTIIEATDSIHILPPYIPLFSQLCDWLEERPLPTTGYTCWALGIGATALCIRWGTYLSVLMDETKPFDPQFTNRNTGIVTDGEMKRINIEASSNYAFLLERLDHNEIKIQDLLLRAYKWLPMPQKRVKCNRDAYKPILWGLFSAAVSAQSNNTEQSASAVTHPYRALANTVIHSIYRMGPIESYHADWDMGSSLMYRRFTSKQIKPIMRSIAEQMSGVVDISKKIKDPWLSLPPWPQSLVGLTNTKFYPDNWSLTEASSPVHISKVARQSPLAFS